MAVDVAVAVDVDIAIGGAIGVDVVICPVCEWLASQPFYDHLANNLELSTSQLPVGYDSNTNQWPSRHAPPLHTRNDYTVQITGESMPVTKSAGDLVFGSTVNQLGSFIMLAQGVGQDTALNQVVRLVQVRAQKHKSYIQACGSNA